MMASTTATTEYGQSDRRNGAQWNIVDYLDPFRGRCVPKKMHPSAPLSFRPESLRIASPCLEDWNAMPGDNRTRFCGACKQNVYDVSGLAVDEIQQLVFAREGRLCVRMLARHDGTMVTKDCRSRIRALRAKGMLGWMAFLILIVPITLGSHLMQVTWLWDVGCQSMGKPQHTPSTSAPASTTTTIGAMVPPPVIRPPSVMMGKPMMMGRTRGSKTLR